MYTASCSRYSQSGAHFQLCSNMRKISAKISLHPKQKPFPSRDGKENNHKRANLSCQRSSFFLAVIKSVFTASATC